MKQVYEKMIASEDEAIHEYLLPANVWRPGANSYSCAASSWIVLAFSCNVAERKLKGMHKMDLANEKYDEARRTHVSSHGSYE